jgi:hypothetical protein
MGKTAVLIEPGRHVGGLSSGGLGMTDSGDTRVIGGLSREFYRRIRRYYDAPAAWTREKPEDFPGYRRGADALWRFEPHAAEAVFRRMLDEAKVPLVPGERLDLRPGAGVRQEGRRITAIVMESGRSFAGRMFIDATYEGDLMARAGVEYTVGREPNSRYGETLNGIQTRQARSHQFTRPVDPYVQAGDPASGLLPGIHPGPPGEEGSGDLRIQAYCFRMCLTDLPANRAAFPKPAGYDPRQYELLLRYLTPDWNDVFGNNQRMPNRKTDTNNHGAFGTDAIGMSYDYPEGDYATRARIVRRHETYQKGLMWFLANDPRVPETVRRRVGQWGLARDEFTDNGNWPHQIYVREARRMLSDYVMTEQDCRGVPAGGRVPAAGGWRVAVDPVGMGSYNMDSHNVQRYVAADGHARNEGDVEVNPGGPYVVSYRAIRPKPGQCPNLLVPVCLSASHIAYGSIRMEPVFMVLGQSAATAAVEAIDEATDVQRIDYARLRQRLLSDRQILDWTGPRRRK